MTTLQNSSFISIGQVQEQYFGQKTAQARPEEKEGSFQSILTQASAKNEPLRFSRHAANRLLNRNIELTQGQMERLNQAKAQAGEKGINESLILVDELAFIVNVPNNTVVTAMDQAETGGNIFTNIDGAVIG